jgi:hypothetical protein
MGRPLLMSDQNMLNGILLVQCVVNMQHCPARITKQVSYTLIFQGTNEYIRTP